MMLRWINLLALMFTFMVCVGQAQASVERVTYFHLNTQGSPVAATDESGDLLWKEVYEPYGKRMLKEGTGENDHWFTGKREEDGLVYMGARWYSPDLARFLSMDPVDVDPTNPHTFNRYAYANNNPYRYIDPDGRDALDITIWTAALAEPTPFGEIAAATYTIGKYALLGIIALSTTSDSEGDIEDDFDKAREKAFGAAGMTDPEDVEITKVDPETGTATEFKGKNGAKVGYDGPHSSPGEHHDKQHISWQAGGKRSSGGRERGNIPYKGDRHPSRSDRKEQ